MPAHLPSLRPLWLALALVAVCAGPAAAEIGTCLTESGQLMAPWSDAWDPACGADCGAEGVVAGRLEFPRWARPDLEPEAPAEDLTDCETSEEELCTLPSPERVERPSPEDEGPRCLEPGPWCERGDPVSGQGFVAGIRLVTSADQLIPKRAPGTLPGAQPIWRVLAKADHAEAPPGPPPR